MSETLKILVTIVLLLLVSIGIRRTLL